MSFILRNVKEGMSKNKNGKTIKHSVLVTYPEDILFRHILSIMMKKSKNTFEIFY